MSDFASSPSSEWAVVPPSSPVPALVGPTASGKTALALALAAQYPIEIISLDSALIYRGMDIGTAKPTAQEMASVPHHLIDIRNPDQSYSVAEFMQDCIAAVQDIRRRGRMPLIVGGTMMYVHALHKGLDDLPQADGVVRARLEAQAAQLGWPAMHARLAGIDPVTAARLAPNDAQRIERALEVFEITGLPLSAHFSRTQNKPAPLALNILSLEPSDRAPLHAAIEQRFETMLENGFLEEVRRLRTQWPLTPDMPSMRCVGYRQAWAFLEGHIDQKTLRAQGVAATRQLAKRQITWLRSMSHKTVVDPLQPTRFQDTLRWFERVIQASG